MSSMRINRAIAQAGVCSRRAAEQLVSSGQVRVNDKVVTDLATTVDVHRDRIKVRGKLLHFEFRHHYFVYYKPRGVVSTMNDELGRASVGELCATLPGSPRPVGRLDRASEGLMLLCSDGEVANHMTHPRYGVSKQYRVTVSPRLSESDAQRMVDGVRLEDGEAHFDTIELVKKHWSDIGIDIKVNTIERALYYSRGDNNEFDSQVWPGANGPDMIFDPRDYVATHTQGSRYALPWAQWYVSNGKQGEEPPESQKERMKLYDQARATADPEKQGEYMKKVLELSADAFEWVGVCLGVSTFGACKDDFLNTPKKEPDSWSYPNPAPSLPQTYTF